MRVTFAAGFGGPSKKKAPRRRGLAVRGHGGPLTASNIRM